MYALYAPQKIRSTELILAKKNKADKPHQFPLSLIFERLGGIAAQSAIAKQRFFIVVQILNIKNALGDSSCLSAHIILLYRKF